MRPSEKQSTGNRFVLALTLVFLTILSVVLAAPSNGQGRQHSSPFSLDDGNYVVVGVFRYFENAVNYSDFVFRKGYPTKYGYHPSRGFYYVYLNVFDQYDQAREACFTYRRDREFKDAWVFSIVDNNYIPDPHGNESFIVSDTREVVPFDNKPTANPEEAVASVEKITIIPITEETEPDKTGGNEHVFLFNAYDASTHKPVDAQIELVDPARLKEIAKVNANSYQEIKGLETEDNTLQLIGSRFGYRRLEHRLDMHNISGSSADISQTGDTIIVNFELSRLRAGDVAIMYNVYFFNNSAIMRPESRYEVNQLLDMLQENEKYEIIIHGHTNGNGYGPIIKMDSDDTNFFQLSRNNKEGNGSAKKLSKERAATIQRFLEFEGINRNRIKIKGWGGKKMLYDPADPKAVRNVRVEIEIVAG